MKKALPLMLIGFIVLSAVYFSLRFIKRNLSLKGPDQMYGQRSSPSTLPTQENPQQVETSTDSKQKIFLTVNSPKNDQTVSSSSLKVQGKTLANAEVFVNDSDLKVDAQGNFSTTLDLEAGENTIVIVANDSQGNEAEVELMITYQE